MLSHRGFDVYVLEGGIPGPSAEPVPVDSPVIDKFAADVANIDTFSQSAAGKTCAEGEAVSVGSTAHSEELASLRAENEKLLAEIKEYQSAEARMTEQIEQLRGELCDSGEKLGSLYARVSSDAEEKQLLQDQYASLQEQHVDVVSAHKLDLEQLEEQLNESRSQADVVQEKYHQLVQEVASGKMAQQEIQQLQEALTKANERMSVLETDVIRPDEAGIFLLN
jgi:chromosome segregation ATPase